MLLNTANNSVRLICVLTMCFLSSCEQVKSSSFKQGDLFPLAVLSGLITDSNGVLDLEDKTLIVNFWATWCSPCRREMPALQKLSEAIDKNRFLVIGVSVDEDKYLMQEFLLQQKIHFGNYQDVGQHLTRDVLGISSFPETFIISPQGDIIRRITGERSWDSKAFHLLLESTHKAEKSIQSNWAFG